MRAGRLRHRVTIQRPHETRDVQGGVTRTWLDVGTAWASIEPLSGREATIVHQVDSRITHRVNMRYYSGLVATDRLSLSGRTFGIVSVRNVDEMDREHEVMAQENT